MILGLSIEIREHKSYSFVLLQNCFGFFFLSISV